MEIRINRSTCMASGNCVFWAPAVFDQDEEGYAVVIDPEGAPEEKILEAARNCPTQSIIVTEADAARA